MKLYEAKTIFNRIQIDIEKIVNIEEFDSETNDPEVQLLSKEYLEIAYHLSKALNVMQYHQKPVKATGTLVKRPDGRYEIEGTDYYFTSGSPIEIWDSEDGHFVRTKIEYKEDYYAVGYQDLLLDGVLARIR
ncbi:DUF5348 domain-containing protein [Psychrobacillus sp. FSL H8-0487]|uniref:DUF5348 domain-containing protein n=1 Tax=Psychrobacillus sp. FSL H8-0487 TaxID=2921391 RepID=UPI0030FD180D